MIKNSECIALAIIPARSGSKGVINKNIHKVNGKPLLAWTIEAAKKSKCIGRVLVSTDSVEIAKVAIEYGAEIPNIRPKNLATDQAKLSDVVLNILQNLENTDLFKYAILLQPTSPMRSHDDIDKSLKIIMSNGGDTCVSVCPVDESPIGLYSIRSTGQLEGLTHFDFKEVRRQDVPPIYRLNGAIYIFDIKKFIEDPVFVKASSYAYIMDERRSLDIDTYDDIKRFEKYLREDSNE